MEKIRVLISEEELQKRIKEVALSLYEMYKDEEVLFVSVLKGAVFFTVDLAKNYPGQTSFEFIRLSSYSGTNSTGNITLKVPLDEEKIKNKNIVVVEDILDTGNTFKFLEEYILKMSPKSFKKCVLLDKKARRVVPINADIVGFDIDDLFVIGYGLDYNEKYRNLPYIGVLEQ